MLDRQTAIANDLVEEHTSEVVRDHHSRESGLAPDDVITNRWGQGLRHR
jgi:hypothetical protein